MLPSTLASDDRAPRRRYPGLQGNDDVWAVDRLSRTLRQ